MNTSNTINCVYEGGVFRPLQEVDSREGKRLKLTARKFDISKFVGAFGEGSMEELETFEEEAQMGRIVSIAQIYGLKGYAKNQEDGCIKVVAKGEASKIDSMKI